MQPGKISLQNFKCFVGDHSFDFSSYPPGLHFITGENRDEPTLGANGVGKSSLFDGLAYVFYGRSLRNLKAGSLASWQGNTGYQVTLDCVLQGEHYSVTRGWKPSSLKLNETDVEQADIENALGLNQEAFRQAVVIGQFNTMFFDKSPTDKLNFFSDILDLEYWIDRSDDASSSAKQKEKSLGETSRELARIEGELSTNYENLEAYQEKSKKFDSDKEVEVDRLSNEIDRVQEKIDSLLDEYDEIHQASDEYEAKLSELDQKLKNYDGELDTLKSTALEKQSEQAPLNTEYSKLQKQIAKFDGLDGPCPTCNQIVSQEHIDGEKTRLQSEADELDKQIEELNQTIVSLNDQFKSKKTERNEVKQNYDDTEQAYKVEIKTIQKKQREIDAKRNEQQSLEDQLERVRKQENTYQKLIEDVRSTINGLEKEQERLNSVYREDERTYNALKYWVKGFKQIRLYMVQQALDRLAIEVNNNLDQLGLQGWTVQFDVERETKSGGVSKGFHVFVQSPSNSESVPWEAWSGGETQRLRMAGVLGLADLVQAHTGCAPTVEAFDEPTQHLNDTGVYALLDVLYARAHAHRKAIFVIDHRSLDYGGFASTTKIVKENNTAWIEA